MYAGVSGYHPPFLHKNDLYWKNTEVSKLEQNESHPDSLSVPRCMSFQSHFAYVPGWALTRPGPAQSGRGRVSGLGSTQLCTDASIALLAACLSTLRRGALPGQATATEAQCLPPSNPPTSGCALYIQKSSWTTLNTCRTHDLLSTIPEPQTEAF